MFALCAAQLDPTDNPALEVSIKQWLRGELRLISEVKRALIFQKIARHNARHMLFSLAHWLTLTGKSGLLLVLDIARYAESVRLAERGAGNYYSVSATMDLYEVLRQLIDATDELQACFVAVVTGSEFLQSQLQDDRRGIRSYQALYFRIWDEVYDRNRENPFSSLVRITGGRVSQPLEVRPSDVTTVAAPQESDPIAARRAIEALRAGVPNQDAVRLLSPQQPHVEERFRRQLGALAEDVPAGRPTPGPACRRRFRDWQITSAGVPRTHRSRRTLRVQPRGDQQGDAAAMTLHACSVQPWSRRSCQAGADRPWLRLRPAWTRTAPRMPR